MRSFAKSVITWLNSKDEDSAAKKLKASLGKGLRRIWPSWPGGAAILLKLRTSLLSPVVRCDVHGCKFYLDARDQAVAQYLLTSKSYEPAETELFNRCVTDGMTVVDVGANIGYYTVLAAKRVGRSGSVFAFEPEPNNFKILTQNVRANRFQNVRLESKAVLDASREVELFLSDYNFGDHRIFSSPDDSLYDDRKRSRTVVVQGVSLDEYFPERARVDFVKIDVQGAEVPVLLGMERVLSDNPGVLLMMELWPHGMEAFGAPASQAFDFMTRCGFLVFELTDSGLARTDRKIMDRLDASRAYANIVFSRESLE